MVKEILKKILLAFVATGCLAACSREGRQEEIQGGNESTKKTVSFMSLSLNSTDETILGKPSFQEEDDVTDPSNGGDSEETIDGIFNPGRADEQAISADEDAHAALLFDENDGWYGSAGLSVAGPLYLARVELRDKEVPAKLLLVVNADPARLKTLLETLADETKYPRGFTALQTALQWVSNGAEDGSPAFYTDAEGKTYFTMTSSVYGVYSAEGKAEIAVTAPYDEEDALADHIYKTPEEALVDPLTLYVERLVAKFTVMFKDEDGETKALSGDTPLFIEPQDGRPVQFIRDWEADPEDEEAEVDSGEGRWKVHIVNWGINGIEPNAFLFKNMTNTPGDKLVDASFAKKFWWNTFNPAEHPRSYWAVDQHYQGGDVVFGTDRRGNNYPQQFRIAWDKENVTSYQDDSETGYDREAWALDYYPYDAYRTRSVSKYALENTFEPSELTAELEDDGYLRVGTHILLMTQLVIEGYDKGYAGGGLDPETHLLEGVDTKYYNGAEFMTEKALVKWSAYTLASQLTIKPRSVKILGKDDEYREFTSKNSQFYADEAKTEKIASGNAMEYFEIVPAQIAGGDGWVTIGLKEGKQVFVETAGGDMEEITDYIESMVYDLMSPVRAYTEGRMYYAIPVLHEKQFNDGKFDASSLEVGDLGVVRNHWYRLTVRSVGALGTAVHDPGQPIIPNHEPEFKALGVQIEILPWSRILMDDVIL